MKDDKIREISERAENKDTGPLDLRSIRHLVRDRHLPLATAGFPLDDASLPGGACLACPKRSGAQVALWADAIGEEDRCTDRPCYDSKRMAHAERLVDRTGAQRPGVPPRISTAFRLAARAVRGEEPQTLADEWFCP